MSDDCFECFDLQDDTGDETVRCSKHGGLVFTPESELATLRERAERAEAALLSIARNTCCGGCLEAARVASAALDYLPTETPEP